MLTLVQHIRSLLSGGEAETLTDRELLERYALDGDDATFRVLARRHAPLIIGVCRRLLRDPNDVEDVFQAVLLVLARKAGSIRMGESLAGWLHTVAFRLSRRALLQRQRRQRIECALEDSDMVPSRDQIGDPFVGACIDEELARLPDSLRQVLILCDIEERTQDQAAILLGWPRGSLYKRLTQARALLAKRLGRRGIAMPAGLAAALAPTMEGLAADRLECCIGSVLTAVTGQSSTMSLLTITLADEYMRKTMITRMSVMAAVLTLTVGTVAVGAKLQSGKPEPQGIQAVAVQDPRPEREVVKDRFGDPLPTSAVARCGTVRGIAVGGVDSLAYSPDGKLLAWSESGGTGHGAVKLVDPQTGLETRVLSKKFGALVQFSPDGKTVHAFNRHGLLAWDVATGRERFHVKVADVAYGSLSPRGDMVAALDPKEISLYDAATGAKIRSWDLEGQANALFWSRDGKLLASHCDMATSLCISGTIVVWDVAKGKKVKECDHAGACSVRGVFLQDGRLLAGGYVGKRVYQLWDLAKDEPAKLDMETDAGHWHLSLSPDGKTLGLLGPQFLQLIDTETWKTRQSIELHSGKMAWAPDSKSMAHVGHGSQSLSLWDVQSALPLRTFGNSMGGVQCLRFAPNSERLISTHQSGQVRHWSGKTGMPIKIDRSSSKQFDTGWAEPCGLAIARDGRMFASTWCAIHDGVCVSTMNDGGHVKFTPWEDNQLINRRVHGIAFAPVDGYLACGDETGNISTWDLEIPQFGPGKAKKKLDWKGDDNVIRCLAFSSDGKMLFSAAGCILQNVPMKKEMNIKAWDPKTGKLLRGFDGHKGGIYGMVLSSDDRRLFACGDDGKLHAWEVATGREVDAVNAGQGRLFALAISPSGEWLATAGEDGSIVLWDAKALKQKSRRQGHRGAVFTLDFRPDGKILASGSADATILYWDVAMLESQAKD